VSITGYFFDEDLARLVAGQLRAGGFEATVQRGRFAGEDDDEDQPWVLDTDAPDLVVEIAVEEAGGWVEYEHPGSASTLPDPPPLPTGPIRSREN